MLGWVDERHLSVLAVIGSLFSKGEEPPYSVSQMGKEARQLGIPVSLDIDIFKKLVRRGYVHLVKKSGTFYVYPTSHTFLHPPVEDTFRPGLGGMGMGAVTAKDLSVLEIIDLIYSEGSEKPPYSVDLIRRKSREIKIRLGNLSWLVRNLVRLSKEGKIRLVNRSGELYVYPAAYTSSLPSGEEPYKLDLKGKKKGEVLSITPWNAPHRILNFLVGKSESSSMADIRKGVGPHVWVGYTNVLSRLGLIDVPPSCTSEEGPTDCKEKGFRITEAGKKVWADLAVGKRVGFSEEELGKGLSARELRLGGPY